MVIRLFNRHSIFVCFFLLAVVIAVTMAVNLNRSQTVSGSLSEVSGSAGAAGAVSSVEAAVQNLGSTDEMRAVWVPYLSLNMSRDDDKSEQAFLKKFNTIVGNAKKCGMNTLIVQVRPFADALYPSSYFPWSHVVGGTQGVNPGYDPLADMVKASHQAGLKIQAWVNPLRIQVSNTPSILAVNNIYNTWKNDSGKSDWAVDFEGGKYLNPAYDGVRRLVADGTKEIAQKYDVDGIQFDDYFYPTQDASFDQTAYAAYKTSAAKTGTPMALADWRQANISAMVSLVYQEIKSVKPSMPFGIAPQGNVQNDLAMGADVTEWCSVSGYVDYICPQLYVNFENPVLPFDTAAKTWRQLVTGKDIKLYLGLAVYKAGSDADSGTWKDSSGILASQVEYGRQTSCDGFMFYSSDYLDKDQTKQEVQNVVEALARSP
ncbi:MULTISPECIES: glycoside hydrolase family 10 protein [Acutalibacteraceae]|uniref:glycoside hydrolase family 10 protein n=1 Tax=Acutalibacteraceae TaxID=3082771 RepID=UPI001FAA4884|nr:MULTISPECIES: family 10 glycosylhydrolase [Acutalibacteraceae]